MLFITMNTLKHLVTKLRTLIQNTGHREVWVVQRLKQSGKAYLLYKAAMQCNIFRRDIRPTIMMHLHSTQQCIPNGQDNVLNMSCPEQSTSQESTSCSCYSSGCNLTDSIIL
jgi:hypothetical protein